MSDASVLTTLYRNEQRARLAEVVERPAIRPPYTAITLAPTAATATMGAFPQSKTVLLLAFRVSVFVSTTNNGTDFWTVALIDTAGTTLASFTTAAIAANAWTRFSVTTGITQPGASNVAMLVTATTTLAPGAIYVIPEILIVEQT